MMPTMIPPRAAKNDAANNDAAADDDYSLLSRPSTPNPTYSTDATIKYDLIIYMSRGDDTLQ
jgi:hypothetical protein